MVQRDLKHVELRGCLGDKLGELSFGPGIRALPCNHTSKKNTVTVLGQSRYAEKLWRRPMCLNAKSRFATRRPKVLGTVGPWVPRSP